MGRILKVVFGRKVSQSRNSVMEDNSMLAKLLDRPALHEIRALVKRARLGAFTRAVSFGVVLSFLLPRVSAGEFRPVGNIFKPLSAPAESVYEVSLLALLVCAAIFLVVAGLLTVAMIKFRARPGDEGKEPPQIYGSNQLELAWTVIPILIVVVLVLVTAPRILPPFHESLAAATKAKLEKMGVEVRTGAPVEKVDVEGVVLKGERIHSKNVFWAAGVKPSPAAKWLGAEADKAGRVKVLADCSVPGHPKVFVVGDTASFVENGKPLPGVAQVAIQQGRYAGRLIAGRLRGAPVPRPFKYFDKGNMATVSRSFAVMESFGMRKSGLFAKLAWVFVHFQFLVLPSNRFSTAFQWLRAMLPVSSDSRARSCFFAPMSDTNVKDCDRKTSHHLPGPPRRNCLEPLRAAYGLDRFSRRIK